MERMEQFEQTTIDAEITQGSSQPPMMKNTRMNCRLASIKQKLC